MWRREHADAAGVQEWGEALGTRGGGGRRSRGEEASLRDRGRAKGEVRRVFVRRCVHVKFVVLLIYI